MKLRKARDHLVRRFVTSLTLRWAENRPENRGKSDVKYVELNNYIMLPPTFKRPIRTSVESILTGNYGEIIRATSDQTFPCR